MRLSPNGTASVISTVQQARRKEVARAVVPAGPWPVQLRYETGLTSEDYVSRQAWREASLPRCPNHPWGGCSLARHGTYRRKTPAGTKIARWYCPESHTTFSLLPDCLAARLSGTLDELEDVVVIAERAPSLEAAVDTLRLDIQLPGALRWLRRRVRLVQRCLVLVIGLLPDRLAGCAAQITAVRERLGQDAVLILFRALAADQLAHLPQPLGFYPAANRRGGAVAACQQPMGPDPPQHRR
jgi:hypothetical protein